MKKVVVLTALSVTLFLYAAGQIPKMYTDGKSSARGQRALDFPQGRKKKKR